MKNRLGRDPRRESREHFLVTNGVEDESAAARPVAAAEYSANQIDGIAGQLLAAFPQQMR